MFRDLRLLSFRLAALTALAGSAFDPALSPLTARCASCVPRAALAFGNYDLPLSWVGTGGALLLLGLSFPAGGLAVRMRSCVALGGGGVALALLFLQITRMPGLCPTCCLIDAAFLAAAISEATRKPLTGPAVQP